MLESVVMPHDCVAMHRPVAGLRQGRRRERNIMFEIQKIVDRRLHSGMLPARRREGRFRLALPLGRRFPAFLRQSIQFQQTVQRLPVRRAVEAPVEAASPQFGNRLQAAPDQRRRDVGVAAAPHDLVVEHEPVPVLDDADRNAELGLPAGLALGDPPGVLLEDREHLLAVRNLLPLQHAAVGPVGEPPCVARKAVDLVQSRAGADPAGPQRRKRSLRPVRDPARGGQIGPDVVRPGPPLLRFVRPALQRFDSAPAVLPLPPSGHAGAAAGPRRLPKQAADRVPQQVEVGRMADVRLRHERAAAPDQRRARLFS